MSESRSFTTQITTIERFILDQQHHHPTATGALTQVLYDMAVAAKIIASRTTRAGLVGILGSTGAENVQGEEVQNWTLRTAHHLPAQRPYGTPGCHGVGRGGRSHPHPGALSHGQLRARLRPAGRLLQHRL